MEDEKYVNYGQIGKRVRAARLKRHMTQEALAEAADLTVQYLSHIELARSKASLTTFIKLANALDITLDDLVCDSIKRAETVFSKQISDLLRDCSAKELCFIAQMIEHTIEGLRTFSDFGKPDA